MKTTILFIVACLLVLVAPRAEAWWKVSTYPNVVVPTPQPVPQYEARQVPVYDAYGNFVGYQSQQVFVGYVYPTTVYRQESVWFAGVLDIQATTIMIVMITVIIRAVAMTTDIINNGLRLGGRESSLPFFMSGFSLVGLYLN